MKKQLKHLREYHNEAFKSGAYKGGFFILILIIFGIILNQTF